MAKPPAKEVAKKPAQTDAPDRSSLMLTGAVAAAALSAIVLVLAAFDLHFVDLRYAMQGGDAIAAIALVVCALLGVRLAATAIGRRIAGIEAAVAGIREEVAETLNGEKAAATDGLAASRAEVSALLKTVDHKVEAFLGAEFARLKEENASLAAALDARRKADDENLALEVESLRRINAELQERITHWAVDTVENRVERKSLHVA